MPSKWRRPDDFRARQDEPDYKNTYCHFVPFLFPSDRNGSGHQTTFKTVWYKTLRRAKVTYFRIYDLRSTYATRLSAGGVADEWVTQMLRQGDAQVFKKYSQMKLQMKREALEKINRRAGEMAPVTTECARSWSNR